MAKKSSEGQFSFLLFLKEKSVDHNRKRIENLSKANAVKEKVIHLDQLEFLPAVHLAVACDVYDGVFLCCPFSHEMSWMRS